MLFGKMSSHFSLDFFLYRDQVELNRLNADKQNKKEVKRQRAQEKKDQMERQKKENELRKNFQVTNMSFIKLSDVLLKQIR